MQIIDELEPVRRGAAMGAIGYIDFQGDMEWNVAIRTITCKNNTAYFHVGGGIVADSEAQSEHDEVMLKAQALIGGIGQIFKSGNLRKKDAKIAEKTACRYLLRLRLRNNLPSWPSYFPVFLLS